jgi:hypothetical protein
MVRCGPVCWQGDDSADAAQGRSCTRVRPDEDWKNSHDRTVRRDSDLLKQHKKHQATIKMRNRQHYHDLGLVFAKEWGDLRDRADSLGLPLQVNTIGERQFGPLIKKAGVKRIKLVATAFIETYGGLQRHPPRIYLPGQY